MTGFPRLSYWSEVGLPEDSLQWSLAASAGEARLPVNRQGNIGQPRQTVGYAGGFGVAHEEVGIEFGPGECRGDGLDDPVSSCMLP